MASPSTTATQIPAYRWLIAWLTLGLILFAISKWKAGYALLYGLAVLTLLLLLLTQYQAIAGLLAPFNQNKGATTSG